MPDVGEPKSSAGIGGCVVGTDRTSGPVKADAPSARPGPWTSGEAPALGFDRDPGSRHQSSSTTVPGD